MPKHLFIEGPIQEGKSTLIRRMLSGRLDEVGGFSSQRLLNESGTTVGFRIVPAAEAMELTRKYKSGLSDVFLFFGGERKKVDKDLFKGAPLDYLTGNKKGNVSNRGGSIRKKLILLDEIGGVELTVPEFRKALYDVLEEEIPCLGVLKLEASNRNMCRNALIEDGCIDFHRMLREDFKRLDAELLTFSRGNSDMIESKVKKFLNQIFE